MDKMTISITSLYVITILLTNFPRLSAITNKRSFKRHINSLSDWEVGLRESTYHALLRERHIKHPNLKEYLYSAPLLGRQDRATPFGDIAIVARGQLYSAPGGFQFVQDPYQNDCDGCHNTPLRCDRAPCEYWAPQDHERLLALWTVKRIRHRDSQYGFKYDFEYKVSPMSSVNGKAFLTRNGNFDYSIDGHKFVIQRDPPRSNLPEFDPYKNVYFGPPYEADNWNPHYYYEPNDNAYLPPLLPPITDEHSDEDPRNQPYGPNSNKDVFYRPEISSTTDGTSIKQTSSKDLNRDLYNNAIGTLTSKTTTVKTTDEAEFLFPKQKHSTSTKIPFLPTRPTTINKATITRTTKVLSSKPTETTLPSTFSESSRFVQYSEPDPLYSSSVLTTPTNSFLATVPRQLTKHSTSDDDYNIELFGERSTTPKIINADLSEPTNDYMLFGEHVISVVSPPNMSTKDDIVNNTREPIVLNRFETQQSSIPTIPSTQNVPPETTSRSTTISSTSKFTQPTITNKNQFYITRKPTYVRESSTPPSTTKKIKKVTNNCVTLTEMETTTTSRNFPHKKQTVQSTEASTTPNYVNTDDTTINLSSFPDRTSNFDFITETETETYFETTTEQIFTTETPSTITTTATSPITIPKTQSTFKTTFKANKQTTDFPIETSKTESTIKTTFKANKQTTGFPLQSSKTQSTQATQSTIKSSKHTTRFPAGTSPTDDSLFQEDFFGNSNKKTSLTTYAKYPTPTSSSDVDDIFGIPIKHEGSERLSSVEANTPKIIYSNFYLPSPTETTVNNAEFVHTENIQNETLTPVTSQSYITSVSFEVNKKEDNTSQNADSAKSTSSSILENSASSSTKILDSLTMSILSNAKSISYLNEEQNNGIKNRPKRNKALLKARKLKT